MRTVATMTPGIGTVSGEQLNTCDRPVVLINSLVPVIFSAGSIKPNTAHGWRSFGAITIRMNK